MLLNTSYLLWNIRFFYKAQSPLVHMYMEYSLILRHKRKTDLCKAQNKYIGNMDTKVVYKFRIKKSL